MLILDVVLQALSKAWAWLKKDYNWVWVVLLPVGVFVFLARSGTPRLPIVSPGLQGADGTKRAAEENLQKQDAKNKQELEKKLERAESEHKDSLSDVQHKQEDATKGLLDDPNQLNQAMLEAGKEIRR